MSAQMSPWCAKRHLVQLLNGAGSLRQLTDLKYSAIADISLMAMKTSSRYQTRKLACMWWRWKTSSLTTVENIGVLKEWTLIQITASYYCELLVMISFSQFLFTPFHTSQLIVVTTCITHTLRFNGHFSRWTWVSRLPLNSPSPFIPELRILLGQT